MTKYYSLPLAETTVDDNQHYSDSIKINNYNSHAIVFFIRLTAVDWKGERVYGRVTPHPPKKTLMMEAINKIKHTDGAAKQIK
jgi:hypothetical protein